MNFNAPLLKPIRILLFPFSLLFGLAVWLRNWLFDNNILKSSSFNLPIICVGNLSAGGTGKSPMVEYLLKTFSPIFNIAVLSRGYKRKTTGYALAHEESTALEIGDEPMLFHIKFPHVSVAVGEERLVAIPQLLHDKPGTQAIVLDDAFQHRSVKAGMNILLTDYNNLFTRDWYLPTGDLRDSLNSYKRGDIMIVTKCPPDLSTEEKSDLQTELNPKPHQHIFFTTIDYGSPYHIIHKHETVIDNSVEVLLVSGIANPRSLKKFLLDNSRTYYEILYSDHRIFTIDDLREIKNRFNSIQAPRKIILTTEKDAVRLVKFEQELKDLPVYVIPIQVEFLFNEEKHFNDLVIKFIKQFKQKNIKHIDEQKTYS